ncbi:MAG: hypothetical protein QOF78_4426 [Phycisphaerales bacterium]|jgi:hypothetical protein|nr:hypothetical protein [Phycisphaerales bacterium]
MNAARQGESLTVQSIAFFSEEDGDKLIDQLEGWGSDILAKLPGNPPIQPAQVEHLLVIIRRDNTATVYLNELNARTLIQVKREFKKGEAVFGDDIADVHRMEFDGVTVQKDCGVIFIFSVGWRRALFFDFSPLSRKDPQDREYDLEAQLGQFYAYLMFQKRFKIAEQQWRNLFDGQWFPFITLKEATIRKLVSHAGNGWPLDDLSDAIAQEVKAVLPTMLSRWKAAPIFGDHVPFLEKAAEHYSKNDFLSTAAILYPRIEGLLRTHQQRTDPSAASSQKGLSGSATKKAESERHPSSPLLPAKFREYLEGVYFAAFNPNDPRIKVSRNSVGHGVASAEEYSLKSATIGLLIVDQLCYCFSEPSQSTTVSSSE